ncbi:hypothetical protein B0T14DRAFT_77755 [Immersiella caudata]|uniref:RRM domain-containing protein n=1 Tax=Immersiella caudata TaxID=314043 RepID=A0AA39XGV4_9PEZI|nr:hypothetical protein B0T14DRAFT_77755 [Immersiella caudata]
MSNDKFTQKERQGSGPPFQVMMSCAESERHRPSSSHLPSSPTVSERAPDGHSILLRHNDTHSSPYYILIENLPDSTSWQAVKDYIKSQFGRRFVMYIRLFDPGGMKGWVRVLGFSTYKQVTSILRVIPFRGRKIITTNPGYNDDGSGSVFIRDPLEADKQLAVRPAPLPPLPLSPTLPQSLSHVGHLGVQHAHSLPIRPGMSYQLLPGGSVVTVYHPMVPFPYHSQPLFHGQV